MDILYGSHGCPARCWHLVADIAFRIGFPDPALAKRLPFQVHAQMAGLTCIQRHGFTVQKFIVMATVRIILGIICFAVISGYRLPDRHLLDADGQQRERLVRIAREEIGVREQTGHNDGERVESYLATVGLESGQPWCAAFVSWVFEQEGYAQPRTGWSPALFNAKVNTRAIQSGNVFGIWFPNLKRIAHVGLVEKREGNWLINIEGNTNVMGSREGDGVYRKRRLVKYIYAFADWLKIQEERP